LVLRVSGCFVVCWTPGLVLLLLDGVKCNCGVLKVEKFCLVLAELNSMMNPIIYSYRDQDMRRTFKHILCCLCRRGRQTGNRADVRFNTLNQEVLTDSNGSENTQHAELKSSSRLKASKR
ncbi:lysophosphatidic acid receptor 2b isoform X2, partial [Silurus asotus]